MDIQALIIDPIKKRIWEYAKNDLPTVKAAMEKAGKNDNSEKYWKKVLAIVRPKKKPKEPVSPEHLKRYRDAKYAYESKEFPEWIKAGHFLEPVITDPNSTNGLTTWVCNFLNWSGHFANRTGNEGRVIEKNGKQIRIQSSSKKGMQDIDANLTHPDHKFGIPWKIEIKAGSDTHKKHQIKYGEKVGKTGAHYSVVRTVEDFFQQYDQLMIGEKRQISIFG